MHDLLIQTTFAVHLGSTLFMAGVIWFVQVVHYPLFANTGRQDFTSYEDLHTKRTTWVVAPPMLAEAVTSLALIWFRGPQIADWQIGLGLVLVAVNWSSTWLLQIPCHQSLANGFHPTVHRRLVNSNWIRTVAWSLRTVLVLSMIPSP